MNLSFYIFNYNSLYGKIIYCRFQYSTHIFFMFCYCLNLPWTFTNISRLKLASRSRVLARLAKFIVIYIDRYMAYAYYQFVNVFILIHQKFPPRVERHKIRVRYGKGLGGRDRDGVDRGRARRSSGLCADLHEFGEAARCSERACPHHAEGCHIPLSKFQSMLTTQSLAYSLVSHLRK